ncbi:hypothetical protein L873DRAFT_1817978 [Choiromyces venosus 120613-1]|uniref:Myb-like domain-containing protein n=1 Tax=Choiromyces venosus 120613-1 TaxID=1336337 RepID=A0A3N4J6Z0_9PEZI|nr:hypothetical protein L873DRAFT_1817978 [Choiromyces venosus 120613-1]
MNCPPEYPFQNYSYLAQTFFPTTTQLPLAPYPSPQHSPLSPELEQKYFHQHHQSTSTIPLDPFLPGPPPRPSAPQEPMSPPPPSIKQESISESSPEFTTTATPATKRPRQRGPPTKHSDTTSRYPIAEDNDRLLKLKEQGKDWKEIAKVFKKEGRGNLTTNVIRVRFYRLKDKAVVWEDEEIERLKAAIADVEKRRWELVSAKMAELGGGEGRRFSAALCERKARGL